jgi:hypothetical protein
MLRAKLSKSRPQGVAAFGRAVTSAAARDVRGVLARVGGAARRVAVDVGALVATETRLATEEGVNSGAPFAEG